MQCETAVSINALFTQTFRYKIQIPNIRVHRGFCGDAHTKKYRIIDDRNIV